MQTLSRQARYILFVLIAGWMGLLLLPWYGTAAGFWSLSWVADPFSQENAPGLFQALRFGRAWLWPIPLLLVIPFWKYCAQVARALL